MNTSVHAGTQETFSFCFSTLSPLELGLLLNSEGEPVSKCLGAGELRFGVKSLITQFLSVLLQAHSLCLLSAFSQPSSFPAWVNQHQHFAVCKQPTHGLFPDHQVYSNHIQSLMHSQSLANSQIKGTPGRVLGHHCAVPLAFSQAFSSWLLAFQSPSHLPVLAFSPLLPAHTYDRLPVLGSCS